MPKTRIDKDGTRKVVHATKMPTPEETQREKEKRIEEQNAQRAEFEAGRKRAQSPTATAKPADKPVK